MVLASYVLDSCCSPLGPVPSVSKPSALAAAAITGNALPRPRGLWKARGTTSTNNARLAPHPPPNAAAANANKRRAGSADSFGDYDDDDDKQRFYRDNTHHHENDEEHLFSGDELSDTSSKTSSSGSAGRQRKRRRLSEGPAVAATQEEAELYWDHSTKCELTDVSERVSNWTTRMKLMNTSSIVSIGNAPDKACDLDDWADLKELFAKATDVYESQEPTDTMPLLRGVMHECHRILKQYPDPSLLFATQPPPEKPPPKIAAHPEWPPLSPSAYQFHQKQTPKPPQPEEKKCKCKDLPTAFHTILGSTLFMFGNLIAQDSKLALDGEPTLPTPYWLATLDVFEMGENLPVRTTGRACASAPQDWRMAVVWGRTLVNLAEEVLSRRKANVNTPAPSPSPLPTSPFPSPFMSAAPMQQSPDEPIWPKGCLLALIRSSRPLISVRISLATASPTELLQLAQDQFARGIFHMPHAQSRAIRPQRPPLTKTPSASSSRTHASTSTQTSPPSLSLSVPSVPPTPTTPLPPLPQPKTPTPDFKNPGQSFSRSKELYTIASAVLLLSEKLDEPSERRHWAMWADGVFNQMKSGTTTTMPVGGGYGGIGGLGHSHEHGHSHHGRGKRDRDGNHSKDAGVSGLLPPPTSALGGSLGGFGNMGMDVDHWRAQIASSRGRCALVVGSARAEEMESALERGDVGVLKSAEAEEAREALRAAVGFLEKAREVLGEGESAEESAGAEATTGGEEAKRATSGSPSRSSEGSGETVTESRQALPIPAINLSAPAAASSSSSPAMVAKTTVIEVEGERFNLVDSDEVVGEIVVEDDVQLPVSPSTTSALPIPVPSASSTSTPADTPAHSELRTLLAEALLTLANLTIDETEREALYEKAQKESGGLFVLDEDMSEDEEGEGEFEVEVDGEEDRMDVGH